MNNNSTIKCEARKLNLAEEIKQTLFCMWPNASCWRMYGWVSIWLKQVNMHKHTKEFQAHTEHTRRTFKETNEQRKRK